jgi:transcription antitermination factor NusG
VLLFVPYIFVRVTAQWHAIIRTPGVVSLIRHNDRPARVPDEEIGKLIRRSDRDGIIRLSSPPPRPALRPGAHVSIVSGPLAGFDAIYQGQTAREREVILMNLLGGAQVRVEVTAGLLVARH